MLLERDDQWQVAYVFPKGEYAKVKAEGFEAFQRHVVERVPFLADRIGILKELERLRGAECRVEPVEEMV